MAGAGQAGNQRRPRRISCSTPPQPGQWPRISTGRNSTGSKLHLLLNKHPYADAMIADLDNFKSMTGMDVTYDIFPEDVYFDKVTAALSSKSSQYDAFMTGAYMTWTYGPAGWIEDLNQWIKDPAKTNPSYNWEDVLPGLRASTAWDGVPGSQSGRRTPSNGASRGASSSTRPPTTGRCTTKPASNPPNNLPELWIPRQSSRRISADLTALACGDPAHGRRSIPASCPAIRITARGLHRQRRQAQGRDEHARNRRLHKMWVK